MFMTKARLIKLLTFSRELFCTFPTQIKIVVVLDIGGHVSELKFFQRAAKEDWAKSCEHRIEIVRANFHGK